MTERGPAYTDRNGSPKALVPQPEDKSIAEMSDDEIDQLASDLVDGGLFGFLDEVEPASRDAQRRLLPTKVRASERPWGALPGTSVPVTYEVSMHPSEAAA